MDIKELAELGRQDKVPQTLALAWASHHGHNDPIAQAIAYDDARAHEACRASWCHTLCLLGLAVFVGGLIAGSLVTELFSKQLIFSQTLGGLFLAVVGMVLTLVMRGKGVSKTQDAEGFAADLSRISTWWGVPVDASLSPADHHTLATAVLSGQAREMLRLERVAEKASSQAKLRHMFDALGASAVFHVMLETFFRYGLTDLDWEKYAEAAEQMLDAEEERERDAIDGA